MYVERSKKTAVRCISETNYNVKHGQRRKEDRVNSRKEYARETSVRNNETMKRWNDDTQTYEIESNKKHYKQL